MFKLFKKRSASRGRREVVQQPGRPSQIFSYHASRSANSDNSGRLTPKASQRLKGPPWWHFIPSVAALLAIVISLGTILALNTNPQVVHPSDSSAALLRPTSVYQAAAHDLLQGSPLNRSKLTIDTGNLTRKLKQQFPELSEVNVALPLIGRRPIIYVVPSPPALRLITQQGTYIVNQLGKAVVDTGRSPNLYNKPLPVVLDQSGLTVRVGEAALPGKNVDFITTVVAQLAAQKFTVKSLTLPASSSQLDVGLNGQTYIIKMNLNEDARQQVGAFVATQQNLSASHQLPTGYFDVRVPERVYYK